MPLKIIGPRELASDFQPEPEDIEWELCCSAREACSSFFPLADLDSRTEGGEASG